LREEAVTKVLATIALGAVGLGLVAQPVGPAGVASAKPAPKPKVVFVAVGEALAAQGITACETADWAAKVDESDAPFNVKKERARRLRLVMAPGRPCPARAAYGDDEVGWENAHDALVMVTVYKSTLLPAKTHGGAPRFTFVYGKHTLVSLTALSARELEAPFVAAMRALPAKKLVDTPEATVSPR
jgi:hypothetical protein